MTPIEHYVYTYPQLTLPIREGESKSEEYLTITRKCILPDKCIFPMAETGEEERVFLDTPAGKGEALYLPDREIFERFVRCLAYRCEPVQIPRTTGAMLISGINNIRKYLNGEADYKDTVLLISKGYYSNVAPELVGIRDDEWIDISKKIRIYHEFAHFISRRLYIEHKEAVRDEVIADCIGLVGALGNYDAKLAQIIIGIENNTIRQDARLINYVEADELQEKAVYARDLIVRLEEYIRKGPKMDPFELLVAIEESYIK